MTPSQSQSQLLARTALGNSATPLSPLRTSLSPGPDTANGCKTLKEVYKSRAGGYEGRSTVPMLWDAKKKEVVCNESYDIIQLFNSGLNELARNPGLDLSPPALKQKIQNWNTIIYPNVNNGVYRCGFAQSQEAYDTAVREFETLDVVEDHLSSSRYLCEDELTLADVCMFTTLIRFDLVYNALFKCTKKKLIEYPNLHAYTRDIFQIPEVAETCNFGAIMEGYYKTLFPLNPGNIQPVMPAGSEHEVLLRPHNRDSVSITDRGATGATAFTFGEQNKTKPRFRASDVYMNPIYNDKLPSFFPLCFLYFGKPNSIMKGAIA